MKKHFLVTICLISATLAAQDFTIKFPNTKSEMIDFVTGRTSAYPDEKITELELSTPSVDPVVEYSVQMGVTKLGTIKSDGKFHLIKSPTGEDLRDKSISIVGPSLTQPFTIPSDGEQDGNKENGFPQSTAQQKLATLFPDVTITPYGIVIPTTSATPYTKYKGEDFIHIFFDQNGGLLLSAVPQGIANKQYVVHIIYMTDKYQPSRIEYSVEQTAGEYSDALVFWNDGQLSSFEYQSGSIKTITYDWRHKEQLLSTSTSDIKFNVYRSVIKAAEPFEIDKKLMASAIIKMSKVYHGSFNVGIVNSRLSNPTFERVLSPFDSTQNVVKQSSSGSRIVITGMATFYASPVIWIEKFILRRDIPKYKLTGRNFLDDHEIYERVYPVIGLSLDNKARENLFFGLNWEFARGGAIFFGAHYGRVNTFNTDDGFTIGSTSITSHGFDFRNGTKMQTDWAMGVNLDLLVVRNLLRQTK